MKNYKTTQQLIDAIEAEKKQIEKGSKKYLSANLDEKIKLQRRYKALDGFSRVVKQNFYAIQDIQSAALELEIEFSLSLTPLIGNQALYAQANHLLNIEL